MVIRVRSVIIYIEVKERNKETRLTVYWNVFLEREEKKQWKNLKQVQKEVNSL